MSKKIMLGLMIVAFSMGNISSVMAETTNASSEKFMKAGFEMHLEKMAETLSLTDAQIAQIKALFEAEKTSDSATMEQLKEIRKQIRTLAMTDTFNETAVRALVEQASKLKIEIAVSHARVQNQIYNLLTAEQKALASAMAPLMMGGPGGPGSGL